MVFQVQAGIVIMVYTQVVRVFIVLPALLLAGCGTADLHKGNLSLELGDYTMAISFYSRALEKNPARFEARLGIGKAYLQQAAAHPEDSSAQHKALMHLEIAHTLEGGGAVTSLLGQVWTERGAMLATSGDTFQALEALSRAIAIDQKQPEPLNLAGIMYYKTGRTMHARKLFEKAVACDSSNITSLFNLGMLCWEEGQVATAHTLWLKALKAAPDDDELLYWFAAAEQRLRDATIPGDTLHGGS